MISSNNDEGLHIHRQGSFCPSGETGAEDSRPEGCHSEGHSGEHLYRLEEIEEAYRVFENREEGVIKIAVTLMVSA